MAITFLSGGNKRTQTQSALGAAGILLTVYTSQQHIDFHRIFSSFLLRLCCGQDDFVFYLSFNIKLFNGYFHVRLGGY